MNPKILIIDNDQSIIEKLSVLLEGMGYECLVEGEGEACFARGKDENPALIILSVELPDVSGYLICKKIKEDKELRKIPLILISSEAKPKDFEKHRKLKVKANDYLSKPFSDSDMKIKVENLLGIQATREEYAELEVKVHDFLEDRMKLENKIEEQDNQILVLQEDLRSIGQERDEARERLSEELRALEGKHSVERKAILLKGKELHKEVEQLRKNFQEQQRNETVLRVELGKLGEDKSLLERRVSELEGLIREIEVLEKRLEQANAEKEKILKQFEKEAKDREQILKEKEALKKEMMGLQQSLEKSEQKLNRVRELVEKTRGLKTELKEIRNEKDRMKTEYEAQLDAIEEEGKGLRNQVERLQEE